MAEYIERDRLIAWIEHQKRLSKLGTILAIQDSPAVDVEAVVLLESAANGVTVQGAKDINVPSKWIPVTERLPERNKMVLCFCENITIQGGFVRHTGSYDNGDWFLARQPGASSFPFLEWKVTHWMPLPEMPLPEPPEEPLK